MAGLSQEQPNLPMVLYPDVTEVGASCCFSAAGVSAEIVDERSELIGRRRR